MRLQLIAPGEVDAYLTKENYVLIDLRDYEDYAAGHLFGAQNLPYIYFDRYVNHLPRNKHYIVYCSYGSVSMLAARELAKRGYDVLSISGGISSYRGRLFV